MTVELGPDVSHILSTDPKDKVIFSVEFGYHDLMNLAGGDGKIALLSFKIGAAQIGSGVIVRAPAFVFGRPVSLVKKGARRGK